MQENIFTIIARMRKGMKLIGYSDKEIKEATNEVTECRSYEEALKTINKYWK